MIGGRLGDMFGYELMLKIGMFFFNTVTLLCVLVSDKIGLVVGHALQGKFDAQRKLLDVIVEGISAAIR